MSCNEKEEPQRKARMSCNGKEKLQRKGNMQSEGKRDLQREVGGDRKSCDAKVEFQLKGRRNELEELNRSEDL